MSIQTHTTKKASFLIIQSYEEFKIYTVDILLFIKMDFHEKFYKLKFRAKA